MKLRLQTVLYDLFVVSFFGSTTLLLLELLYPGLVSTRININLCIAVFLVMFAYRVRYGPKTVISMARRVYIVSFALVDLLLFMALLALQLPGHLLALARLIV